MDETKNERMDETKNERTNERMKQRTNERTNERSPDERLHGWIDVRWQANLKGKIL